MLLIHDKRLPTEYKDAISAKIPDIVFFPFSIDRQHNTPYVYESILCHPDIYLFRLDENTIIHAPVVPGELKKLLRENGLELICGKNDPFGQYPRTVPYNAVRIGNSILHNLNYTDKVILNSAKEKGIDLIDVNQGYSRCSVVAVGNESLITSDKGIETAAMDHGLNVLRVSSGNISLPGEKQGFIGGASGFAPGRGIIFSGDVGSFCAGKKINQFIENKGLKMIDLEGLDLYDAGSLLFLK